MSVLVSRSILRRQGDRDLYTSSQFVSFLSYSQPPHLIFALSVQNHASSYHRVAVADASGMHRQQVDGEGDMGRKYTKRSSGLRRTLQRFMPALFQPSLPVTTK